MEAKKFYVEPKTEVVELHVTNQLLAGSNGQAGMSDYTVNGYEEE